MKRFLSMLLCAAMLISFVPAAWAEGDGQELPTEQPVEEQVEQPAEEPYVPPVEEPSAPEEPTVTEPPVVEPTAEPEPSTEPEPTAEPEPAAEPEPEEPGFITFSGADYRDEALIYQYIVDTAAGETVTLAPAPVYDGVLAYVWLRYDAALGTYAEIDPAENPTANSPALTVTVAEGDIGAASLYACSVYADDGAAGCAAFTFRQRAADAAGTEGVLVETITVTAPGNVNSVDVGETLQLSASVTPEDAENKAVIWTSSDEETATVDENGLVTGVADGVVTIYAAAADDSGAVGEIELTVGNGIALLATNGREYYYDANRAIEYAHENYDKYPDSTGKGRCSEFVMDCLWSGGLKDVYGSQGETATDLATAKRGQNYSTATLYRYLKNKGYLIEDYYNGNELAYVSGIGNTWQSTVKTGIVAHAGDPVFYYALDGDKWNPRHFVICAGNENGYDRAYGVTPAWGGNKEKVGDYAPGENRKYEVVS